MTAIQQKLTESVRRTLAAYKRVEALIAKGTADEARLAAARDQMADLIGDKLDGGDMTAAEARTAHEKYRQVLLDLGRTREALASAREARDHIIGCLGHDPALIGKKG